MGGFAPDARESRLEAIRQEAQEKGHVSVPGIRPDGFPLPMARPKTATTRSLSSRSRSGRLSSRCTSLLAARSA
jgi:hypothetical protein